MKCVIQLNYSLVFIIFLINPDKAFSQNTHTVMNRLAERLKAYTDIKNQTTIYLNTSKDTYIRGEDLWFNAFILNAQTFSLSALDKTLYIKLEEKGSDSSVWQEMYPIRNGLCAGHVYLSQTLPEGDYLLEAYTAHSYFSNQSYYYAITPILVIKEPHSIRNYNQQRKNAAVKKDNFQFGVFPEGGNLIAGLQNQVAFKAVNKDGRPEEVNGTLLKGNSPILSFKTVHAGMGSFYFTPEKNTEYRIKLENNSDSLYMLPKIQDSGIVMRLLRNENDTLIFKVTTNYTQQKKKVFLRLQIRGMVQSIASGTLTDSFEVKIPVKNSPQGIAEATLSDEQLRPMSERLVYLHPDQKLNISISEIKERYVEKEKVSLKIKTTNSKGNAIPAVLSLRVFDDLFHNSGNTRDIVNYYYLSTQLRGNIYDPSYYFDTTHEDRKSALNILLLTQGWRCYTWNEDVLKEQATSQKPVLSDSLKAYLTLIRRAKKEKKPISIMFFNYNNSIRQITFADSGGALYLSPNDLSIGPRFFIKYFSSNEYRINVKDPFNNIKMREATHKPKYVLEQKFSEQEKVGIDTVDLLQYGKMLEKVTVLGKDRYSDKYLGYLDSIAKYEGNTDYVGTCGWLNCPDGPTDIKPIEGKQYNMFTSDVTSHHHVILTKSNHKVITYHYPKFTEEELLKKFKLAIAKGYYQSRKFYEPNYDAENNSIQDNRNTLAWNPTITTDNNGEANVSFFCSDIHSRFLGIIEGIGGEGLLGVSNFNFSVR